MPRFQVGMSLKSRVVHQLTNAIKTANFTFHLLNRIHNKTFLFPRQTKVFDLWRSFRSLPTMMRPFRSYIESGEVRLKSSTRQIGLLFTKPTNTNIESKSARKMVRTISIAEMLPILRKIFAKSDITLTGLKILKHNINNTEKK